MKGKDLILSGRDSVQSLEGTDNRLNHAAKRSQLNLADLNIFTDFDSGSK